MLAHEPFGIAGVRRGEGVGADQLGVSVVDIMGSVPGDAGMTMLVVVPTEEALAEHPGCFDAGEPVREVRPVLQRLVVNTNAGGEAVMMAASWTAVLYGRWRLLALRSRLAEEGFKPPRGALAEDRRLERRGKGVT